MMRHCQDCQWWEAPEHPVLWGECKRITDCYDMNRPGMGDPASPFYDPALLPSCDEDTADCRRLQTHPFFGCELFRVSTQSELDALRGAHRYVLAMAEESGEDGWGTARIMWEQRAKDIEEEIAALEAGK